jgi:acyl transferase domain-containing protein
VTVSGDLPVIEAVERICNAQGIFNHRLKVDVAYHAHHVELVADSYLAAIQPYCLAENETEFLGDGERIVPFISSVTGQLEDSKTVTTPSYWVRNLTNPVRFSESIATVVKDIETTVIAETGPHSALKGPISQVLQPMSQIVKLVPTYMSSLVRDTDARKSLLELAGHLFTMGVNLNFSAVNGDEPKTRRVLMDLPSYEWDKKARYIHKSHNSVAKMHSGHTYTSFLGWKMPPRGREHVFRQVFTLDEMPWLLRDHRVVGDVLFPFTGYFGLHRCAAIRYEECRLVLGQ